MRTGDEGGVRKDSGAMITPLSRWWWWCSLWDMYSSCSPMDYTVACQAPPSMGFSKQEYWKTKKKSEVAQSCPALCDPKDYSLPGSSIHGIFQARVLEWAAISYSRGSSQLGDQTWVSHIAGRHFTLWATREAQEYWSGLLFPSLGEPDPLPTEPQGSPSVSVLFVKCYSHTTPWPNPLGGSWLFWEQNNAHISWGPQAFFLLSSELRPHPSQPLSSARPLFQAEQCQALSLLKCP